ncbi:MAG: hypothetical protein HQL56_07185 [Magnetococcales bacterium]|nr:hypothetical protein [Magnetococcales bacterium]
MSNLFGNLLGGKAKEEGENYLEVAKAFPLAPPLEANAYRAVARLETPMLITSQDVACYVRFEANGHVYLETLIRGKPYAKETINPRDRTKKAVTSLQYKSLIGVHVHPSGVIFYHCIEENLKGEARQNQPPAEVRQRKPGKELAEERAFRTTSLDLTKATDLHPVIICPNNPKKENMHMVIRPAEGQPGVWGVFLSSPTGETGHKSKSTFTLERGKLVIFDQRFLTEIVKNDPGNIDARAWNMEISDPILMRIEVDAAGKLTVEELFTQEGLTVALGDGEPVMLLAQGAKLPADEDPHRHKWLGKVRQLQQATLAGSQEKERSTLNEQLRNEVLAKVSEAMRLNNVDGVSRLGLEMAVQEVLATVYSGSAPGETAMTFGKPVVELIQNITLETVALVENADIRSASLVAVDRAVTELSPGLAGGRLGPYMQAALPMGNWVIPTSVNNDEMADLFQYAKRYLSSNRFVLRLRQILSEAQSSGSGEEAVPVDQSLVEKELEKLATEMVQTTLPRALVRLVVRSQLAALEKRLRKASRVQFNHLSAAELEQPVKETEIESILKRFDAYADYIPMAFKERLHPPLSQKMAAYQDGIATDEDSSVTSKMFLTYVLALYAAGGNLSGGIDSVPMASPLQVLPEVLPEIRILHPVVTRPEAFVRVTHRGAVVAEIPFEAMPVEQSNPEGVPLEVWRAMLDFSARFFEFHVTGDTTRKENQEAHKAVLNALTIILIDKILNFLRVMAKRPMETHQRDFVEMVSNGRLSLIAKPGESAGDELLDLVTRPKSITDPPINLKKELRRIMVERQNAGTMSQDFRFKQHMRSLSTLGMGNKQNVVLPIKIDVTPGTLRFQMTLNDSQYYKEVSLEERVERAQEEDVVPRVTAAPVRQAPPRAASLTPIAVTPDTPPRPTFSASDGPDGAMRPVGFVPPAALDPEEEESRPVRYILDRNELPLDLSGVQITFAGGSYCLIYVDEAGNPIRENGKVKGRRLGEQPVTVGRTVKASSDGEFVCLHCDQAHRGIEDRIRQKRSNRVSLPTPGHGAFQVVIPRGQGADIEIELKVDLTGQFRVEKPFVLQGNGVVVAPARTGGVTPLFGCEIEQREGHRAVRLVNRLRTGIVVRHGEDLYPLGGVPASEAHAEDDVTVIGPSVLGRE